MTDDNPSQDNMNQRNLENLALDHELDAALAKFAAVEPRAGLEERVLANLLAEKRHAVHRSRWRWPAVATLAAVIAVSLFAIWRSGKPAENIVEQNSSATTQTHRQDRTQIANNGDRSSILPHKAPRRTTAVVVPAPKLDAFPSPQPLSEQERMLTEYVAEHHQQAVLVARARMVELKQDLAEEMKEAAATSNRQTSDQSVSQQQDR